MMQTQPPNNGNALPPSDVQHQGVPTETPYPGSETRSEALPNERMITSFMLHLRASGRTPKTGATYRQALEMLVKFTVSMGMPGLAGLSTEHVRHFLTSLRERGNADATILNRYRSLSAFYGWARDEGELDGPSPIDKIKTPKLTVKVKPSYSVEDIDKLLTVTGGRDLFDLRDQAVILVLYDCGLRAQELCDLTRASLDPKTQRLIVMGKGKQERVSPLGRNASVALDRYLRRRGDDHPALFLAYGKVPMTYEALRLMLHRRCRQAGVEYHGCHSMRRAWAQAWLQDEGSPLDLRYLAGWRSDAMVRVYTRGTERERAVRGHAEHSPADKLRLR